MEFFGSLFEDDILEFVYDKVECYLCEMVYDLIIELWNCINVLFLFLSFWFKSVKWVKCVLVI